MNIAATLSPQAEVAPSTQDDEPPLPASPACIVSHTMPETALLQHNIPYHCKRVLRHSRMSPQSRLFRTRFFPQTSDAEWSDWQWQLRHRIRTLESLRRMITLSSAEEMALGMADGMLPFAVTPHYMALVAPHDPEQAIRRAVIPTVYEQRRSPGEADDPLCEERQSPVPGLVHRYPDRVLLLATDYCSTYCRYCTRSRVVGQGELAPDTQRLRRCFDYIRSRPEIRDVLVSGGDPLTLSDDRLESILSNLRAIPHVEIIRLGTKVPAVLPQRITPQLTRMLRKYHPLWMSLHFMHPDECGLETAAACGRLADAGIPLGSQTVLLKGINDAPVTLKELMQRLMRLRVRPYYLYQCDPISGSEHFRTAVAKGVELISSLRGHTSGYAVPHYVIDAPGGGGKIAVTPGSLAGRDTSGKLHLTNFEGGTFVYPDYVTV